MLADISEGSVTKARQVLDSHQHRFTQHRVDVLSFLIQYPCAFTFRQISDRFCEIIDRATIYRALQAFIDYGIVNRVINSEGNSCFYFKEHLKRQQEEHNDYYQCRHCLKLFQLPTYTAHYLEQLQAQQVEFFSVLYDGNCPDCQEISKS